MHCVDFGESFPTSIDLQKSASIQPRTSPSKFGVKFKSFFIRLLRSETHDALAEPFSASARAALEPPSGGSPCFYLMYKQEIESRELRNAARSIMMTPRVDPVA